MKKARLKNLQNAEYYALMVDILNLIEESKLEALNPLKTVFKTLVATLDEGLFQIRKSEHTANLSALDIIRDNYFKGLSLRVRSESFSPDKSIREQAYKVQILLDAYKNITRENFRKETELIFNLINELISDDYQSQATNLGLTGWINALRQANEDFATLYNMRRDEQAMTKEINLRAVRKETDEQYRSLIKTIEALNILEPSNALSILIAKHNASITKWNNTLAQRSGKKREEKKKEEQPIEKNE